jgi:hypothetical protein
VVVLIFAADLVPHWSDYFKAPHAQAGTTDDLLKAIATKDSDGDGLPDWEEALYGTDPHKVDTFGLGMTDAQAVAKGLIVPKAATPAATVTASGTDSTASSTPADAGIPGNAPAPGSLTEQFAQLFFTQYMAAQESAQASGTTFSSDDVATFVTSAIQQLQQSLPQQDAFTFGEVLPKSELAYLNDAVANNDTTAIDNITKISKAYTNIANAFMKLPVPTELAASHLALANAFAQMGVVTGQLAALNRDPILTSLGLANYTGDATAMRDGFVGLATALMNGGVVLKPSDPGYSMESITPGNGY